MVDFTVRIAVAIASPTQSAWPVQSRVSFGPISTIRPASSCKRPRQGLGPVLYQDVQTPQAADLDQCGLGRHLRPRHLADDRRRPRPVERGGGDRIADLSGWARRD